MIPDVVNTITSTGLFSITLRHERYEKKYVLKISGTLHEIIQSSIFDSLSIVPDTATKGLFVNHAIGYRQSNTIFQCFIRSKKTTTPGEEIPFIELPTDTRLRFLLKDKNDFIRQTDIIAAGSQEVYLFSNRDKTGTEGLISKNTEAGDGDRKDVTDAKPGESCLGIIDIYTSGTSDEYRLLGDSGKVLGRQYKIQFKSKA